VGGRGFIWAFVGLGISVGGFVKWGVSYVPIILFSSCFCGLISLVWIRFFGAGPLGGRRAVRGGWFFGFVGLGGLVVWGGGGGLFEVVFFFWGGGGGGFCCGWFGFGGGGGLGVGVVFGFGLGVLGGGVFLVGGVWGGWFGVFFFFFFFDEWAYLEEGPSSLGTC